MKILAVVFWLVGAVLTISAANVMLEKTAPEPLVFYIGLFVPALICIGIGTFCFSRVRSKKIES